MANLQYGATQAFVYAFTFVGGLFADKILGFRRSLTWGGLLMIIGSLILAVDPKKFFFIGIAFNIVGTGFFKPNISTHGGHALQGRRRAPRRGLLALLLGHQRGRAAGRLHPHPGWARTTRGTSPSA